MKKIRKILLTLAYQLAWGVIVLMIFGLVNALYEYLQKIIDGQVFPNFLETIEWTFLANPWVWIFSLSSALILKRSVQLYRSVKESWLKLKQLETLVHAVGLRSFSSHDATQKEQDWKVCKDTLSKTRSSQLCILGAAGYETFSNKDSPLYDCVSQASCELRILLLNPDSLAFKQRCKHIEVREETYRNWINKSIEFCEDLKVSKNIAVEVRLYDDYPIWKMIFTPEYMWLQWYQNRPVDQTPVYSFQTTEGTEKTSMYYPLTSVFRRRWDLAKEAPKPEI